MTNQNAYYERKAIESRQNNNKPKIKEILFIIISVLIIIITIIYLYIAKPEQQQKYNICFTPGSDCTKLIVGNINKSKKSIYIQAYSFTSKQIANALIDAKKRGVDVNVILDKSQIKAKNTTYNSLINNNIPIWVDFKPAIAHNKVIIFDDCTLETGSFNYTNSAQNRNAENVIIIKDCKIASKYMINWYNREKVSKYIGN